MYKVQRVLITVILLMMAFTFYGCNKKVEQGSAEEQVQKMLNEITNYETRTVINFLVKGQENILAIKQKVEIGGRYELVTESPAALSGYITSFDGEKIKEYNPITKTSTLAKPSVSRNETMFRSFVERYRSSEAIRKEKVTLEGKEVIVLEVDILGHYKYLSKQKVYFDTEKIVPIKMEIYDEDGNKTIQVEFSDFKYNTEMKWDTSVPQ